MYVLDFAETCWQEKKNSKRNVLGKDMKLVIHLEFLKHLEKKFQYSNAVCNIKSTYFVAVIFKKKKNDRSKGDGTKEKYYNIATT